MKKNQTFSMLMISLTMTIALIIAGCKKDKGGDDDGGDGNSISSNYFSVQGASFVDDNFPSPNSDITLENVNINTTALPGGSLPFSINFDGAISEVYIGIEGIEGYYSLSPEQAKSTATIYSFLITLSQNLTQSFTIQISILTEDGSITQVFTETISYMEAGTGALQISLAFDNEKDVDLYVIRPDSTVIYYGNKGPYEYIENEDGEYEYVRVWGLDIDSNASCSIDGINNENVFFPEGYVMSGKYQVYVNLYRNCSPQERQTAWTIVTTYRSNPVNVSQGSNPAAGIFAIDETSNPIGSTINDRAIKVMEFEIVNGDDSLLDATEYAVAPLDATAIKKLENVFE